MINLICGIVKKLVPIATRTIVTKGNNILQGVASFRYQVSDNKSEIASLGYKMSDETSLYTI